MKKILFIRTFGSLPVPAVMGGSVETLLTMLLEQNELDPTFQMHFVSPLTKLETKVTSQYKYTKIHQIQTSLFEKKLFRYINGFNWRTNYKFPLFVNYNFKVWNLIKNIKPDFIIYENVLDALIYKIKHSQYKGGLIFHVHHQFSEKKFVDINIKNVIAVSNFLKRDWEKDCPNSNVKVLNNAINEKYFQIENCSPKELTELKRKLFIRQNDFIVIYTGRIVPHKGVLELIEAVKSLEKDNIKLLMIGSFHGARKEKSNNYIEKISKLVENSNNIIATGYVPYEELVNYYAIADVQAVPSLWEEASGMTAIEGNYCGLPQIITNSGGMPENCSSSTIIIDKSGDVVSQLKEAILKVKNEKIKNCQDVKALTAKGYFDEFVKVMKEFEKELNNDKNAECKTKYGI